MSSTMAPIGYQWLAKQYDVEPVQPFRTLSQIAKTRRSESIDGFALESYPQSFMPPDSLAGHLTFALKREAIHLEFLARLFIRISPQEIENWLIDEPSGAYARRAGFLFEWLTGKALDFKGVTVGNYVDALDPAQYLVATKPKNNARWRVRDNLPGTRHYCPLVYQTRLIEEANAYDLAGALDSLEQEFGEDLVMRSAVWLTIKESMQSFRIEREEKQLSRIQRFAAVMEQRTGQMPSPLSEPALATLQSEIVGTSLSERFGLRRSPVFVGEESLRAPVVHYIAPHWDDVPELIDGLKQFAAKTAGPHADSIVRAAVLSFGFVYIHPLADGNGRISRFLINDTLRRDGAVPAPFILPVSATITSSTANRRSYDQVLEVFSKPLMRKYADAYRFGPIKTAEDGQRYNMVFDQYQDALPAWRYPDLTQHAEYLANVIQETIKVEMRNEAAYLRDFRMLRGLVKEIIEGPDPDVDRIIQSFRGNDGKLSKKLLKEFPRLGEADIADRIAATIQEFMDDTDPTPFSNSTEGQQG